MSVLNSKNISYRPDIDGLRAISVVLVVLYHAFPEYVPGGYVGVDVFFVISGFLITKIIIDEHHEGVYSIKKFYFRRIKRIFPTLLFILIFVYILGFLTLFPSEFIALNKHVISGGTFSSNLLLWSESGYFDTNSEKKPLLHLWSLGVEEQFYIVWPLLLAFTFRKKFSLINAMLSIAFISFCFSIYMLKVGDRTQLFYSPITRSWELMIGALVTQVNFEFKHINLFNIRKRIADILSFLGITLILISSFSFTKQLAYPGWVAILPVSGALFMILAGSDALVNKFFLANPIIVFIGIISYPLYLWHWPILSYINILFHHQSNEIKLGGVCASFILAYLTYKWIENPIRTGKLSHAIYFLVLGLTTIVLLAAVSGLNEKKMYYKRDFVSKNPISVSGGDGGDMGFTVKGCDLFFGLKLNDLPDCRSDSRGNLRFAILGDSKATALFPGLVRFASSNGGWILMGGAGSQGSPVPILSNDPDYSGVQRSARLSINSIKNNKSIEAVLVVVAARSIFQLENQYSIEDLPYSNKYGSAYNGFRESVVNLLDSGKKVIFLIDNPTLQDPLICIPRVITFPFLGAYTSSGNNNYCSISFAQHLILSSKYRQLLYDLREIDPKRVFVLDPLEDFCVDSSYCSITKNNRLLYSYTDHMSDYAASMVANRVNKFILEEFK